MNLFSNVSRPILNNATPVPRDSRGARFCLAVNSLSPGVARSRVGSQEMPGPAHLVLFTLAALTDVAEAFASVAPGRPLRVRPQRATFQTPSSRTAVIQCAASGPQQQATLAASILGLVSQPIMWWSLYTLKTTGCGLPAGPFGLIGAAEGVSYLVVIGFVGAAILSKFTTGKGFPAGPFGLLGAAEGLSFLSAVAGLAVLGFQLADYGYLPEAVPTEGGVCSDI
jgi:hypothetical protein